MKKRIKAVCAILAAAMLICGCNHTAHNKEEQVSEKSFYLSDALSAFEAGKKSDFSLSIPVNNSLEPGIFVGHSDEQGYHGYAAVLETVKSRESVVLYKIEGEEWTWRGDRPIFQQGQAANELMLEVTGKTIRVFIMDDLEGVTPWPEIEVPNKVSDGDQFHYIERTKQGGTYEIVRDEKAELRAIDDVSAGLYVLPEGKTDIDDSVELYTNPIKSEYADPDVYYEDGSYYLFATGPGATIYYERFKSEDLLTWWFDKVALQTGVWGNYGSYWAPDVEKVGDKYYMVCSIGEQLGMAVSDTLRGQFEIMGDPIFPNAIDGHLFVDDDGKVYLYCVQYGDDSHAYGIYGYEMDTETMLPKMETEKLCLHPTEEWEGPWVTEGPYMLKHNGIYYLTYTGDGFTSQRYAVGYATATSPLGPYAKEQSGPILVENGELTGTGHHSFQILPNGDLEIIYHCHHSFQMALPRNLCVNAARFAPTKSGIDRLEIYGPSGIATIKPIQPEKTAEE